MLAPVEWYTAYVMSVRQMLELMRCHDNRAVLTQKEVFDSCLHDMTRHMDVQCRQRVILTQTTLVDTYV